MPNPARLTSSHSSCTHDHERSLADTTLDTGGGNPTGKAGSHHEPSARYTQKVLIDQAARGRSPSEFTEESVSREAAEVLLNRGYCDRPPEAFTRECLGMNEPLPRKLTFSRTISPHLSLRSRLPRTSCPITDGQEQRPKTSAHHSWTLSERPPASLSEYRP